MTRGLARCACLARVQWGAWTVLQGAPAAAAWQPFQFGPRPRPLVLDPIRSFCTPACSSLLSGQVVACLVRVTPRAVSGGSCRVRPRRSQLSTDLLRSVLTEMTGGSYRRLYGAPAVNPVVERLERVAEEMEYGLLSRTYHANVITLILTNCAISPRIGNALVIDLTPAPASVPVVTEAVN
jgi:hypothetical protein